ncbi:hypothetical protein Psyaliredsea_02650 [Psychrobacter alimentarius]
MNLNDTALSTETAATQDGDYTNKTTKTDLIKADPSIKQNFYDFYLNEHQNMACRRLHFAGSSFGLLGLAKSVKDRSPAPLLKGIAAGYACAWVGHFSSKKQTSLF